MGTDNKATDDSNKPEILKGPYSSPERSFTTAWFRCNLGLFRVNLTIISPEPKHPQDNFSLTDTQVKTVFEAIADVVVLLKEELR